MPYDEQKKQVLENARSEDQRKEFIKKSQKKKQGKAQKTLNKYSPNRNASQARNTINQAKNLAKSATSWGAISLMSQVKISDFSYFLALIAAILKDLLDLAEATGIGYALVVILTFLASIFIAFMMILASFSEGGQGSQRIKRKIIRSWLILIAGTIIELIPGIDFLPIESLSVVIIFALALSARKEAKKQIQ